MKFLKCLLVSLSVWTLPAMAATINFAGPSTVSPGDDFQVSVLVTGATDLYAWQFDIGFNPAVLAASQVDEGDFLLTGAGATFFLPGVIDNAAGTISFNADSIFGDYPGANGDGWLATISFHANGAGLSPLTLFNVTLMDSFGEGQEADAASSSVSVEAVPEPATGTLFILGSGAILAVVRRRRRQ